MGHLHDVMSVDIESWLREQTAPTCLDAFCCEGGGSAGWARAGLAVFGVDLFDLLGKPGFPKGQGFSRSRYPFASHRGDAVAFIAEHGHRFDVVVGSPPCQHASAGTRALRQDGAEYPHLIEPTREAMIATGRPYVIENVSGAALHDPVELCGCMFDLTARDEDGLLLRLERTRLFESNIPLTAPRPHHHDPDVWVAGSYGGARRQGNTPAERRHNAKYVRHGGYVPAKKVQQALLGIDWMTQRGMHQALPPVYTEHLGLQLLAHLEQQVAA